MMKRFNEEGSLTRLVAEMPKAELHLHLDGALSVSTALELAATRGVDAPRTYAEMFRALVPGPHLSSQAELVQAFDLPVALMQDAEALERVTVELIEAKAADRVDYLEIRWAPLLHTRRGLDVAGVLAAVCRGRREGMRRTGAAVGLVCVAVRSDDPAANRALAVAAADFQAEGVVGFDLAGREADHPDPLDHRAAFEAARTAGMAITLHAGELHDGGAGVRRALELDPPRIAHGATAIEDPLLCDELRSRDVMLDVCPTSNVQAATFADLAAHPVAALHRRGVPVSISTDDPTIANVTLTEEWVAVLAATGLTPSELWRINLGALRAAFAEPALIDALHERFSQWSRWVPELVSP
jgi:adenosine deaminase